MSSQTTFIGRQKELQIIEDMVSDPDGGRHILPIVGEPGVGKTWLLREIYRRYSENTELLVVRIDYGESRPQSLPGISLYMMEQFGEYMTEQQKTAYRKHMTDWEELLKTEIDPDRIREEQNKIYHFGIDLIWQMSQQRRTLILSDSLDTEKAMEDIQRTNLLAANLPNTIIILAGRPTEFTHKMYGELPELYKRWNLHETYQLNPFSQEEIADYITQANIPNTKADTPQRMTLLTGGHPVLTAATVEWLQAHPEGLPEHMQVAIEAIEADEATRATHRKQLETALVETILPQETPTQRALLYLSYINQRFDPQIVRHLLHIEDDTTLQNIIQALHNHVFSRHFLLSQGELPHKEIQRVLFEQVWDQVDPDVSLRRSLAQEVINSYYLPEIERLNTIVQEKLTRSLQPTLEKLDHRDQLPVPDEYWPKRDLQMECLYYSFCISETTGWSYLNQLFDDALHRHYSLIQMDAIVQAVYKLAPQQVNSAKFQVRFSQILFEKGEIQRAANVAEKAIDSPDIEPADAAKAFIVLADSTTDPAEKVTHFKVAHEMAEAAEDPVLELKVLNRLGLAYRRQGHWSEAEAAYLQVLRMIDEAQEPNQYAATLNNLSFVYMLNGNPIRADNLAEKALRIRREQGNIHGLGFSYSTRGRIAESLGDYVTALRYHRTAVDLCELVGDSNNAALMQVNVSACECHAQKFETAHLLLSRALRNDLPNIRARALQQAARIYVEEAKSLQSQGSLPQEIEERYSNAEKAAQQALGFAKEVLDDHLVASTLIDIAMIAFLKDKRKDDESWQELHTILKDHNYKLEKGRMAEIEGHLAFANEDIDGAFRHYLDACEILAEYSPAHFHQTFEQVRDRFLDASREDQRKLCQIIHERYADIPAGTPLVAFKELCVGEIIGF